MTIWLSRKYSRQEDEKNLKIGGVVNNIHKSFNESDDHSYTPQKTDENTKQNMAGLMATLKFSRLLQPPKCPK